MAEQTSHALNHSKLLTVKDLFTKTITDTTLQPTDMFHFRALHTLRLICVELGQWEEVCSIG